MPGFVFGMDILGVGIYRHLHFKVFGSRQTNLHNLLASNSAHFCPIWPKKQGYGYSTSSAIYSSVRPAHPSSLIKQTPPSLPLRQNPAPDHQSIHEVAILHSANPSYWRFQANGTFEVNPPNIKPISRQDKPHQAVNAALRNEKKCDSPDFGPFSIQGFHRANELCHPNLLQLLWRILCSKRNRPPSTPRFFRTYALRHFAWKKAELLGYWLSCN